MKRSTSLLYVTLALFALHVPYTCATSTIIDYADYSYEELQAAFHENNAWGLHTTIDIKNCNKTTISSPRALKTFVIWLCDLIKMHRYGDPQIVNFGRCKEVEGYTLVQLIETSDITAHFVNLNGSAYLDIFSCKLYNPHVVAEFIKEFFDGGDHTMHVLLRI